MKVGKSPYGQKWHILRDDDTPICGYMSFNWKEALITEKDTPPKNLCSNCHKAFRKLRSRR